MSTLSFLCVLIFLIQTSISVPFKAEGKSHHGHVHNVHHSRNHAKGTNYDEDLKDNNVKASGSNCIPETSPDPSVRPGPSTPGCPLCGQKTWPSEERIVGGEEAQPHAHPWQVGLITDDIPTVWCGAVLITDQYLLTAAHCAKSIHPDEQITYAILGTNRVLQGEQGSQQRIPVSEAFIHEDYNPLNLANDIAVLRLETPAVLGPTVIPICLPDADSDYTGVMATVSGWGRLTEDGDLSETLQEAKVQLISHEECAAIYTEGSVTQDHICAGGNNKDSCQADSGGPLVANGSEGNNVLIGITSWGRGCGRPGIPGVYVRVASYLDWILRQVLSDSCEYLAHLPVSTDVPEITPTNYSCSCGMRNTAIRIIGGRETEVHEFPWQVAIVGYYGIRPFCGAVVISDQWILTAAHCAIELHLDDQLMLGDHDWKHASESSVTLRRKIAQIIVHPNYDKRPMDSDVALLKLSEPLDFSTYKNAIAPVCLPPPDESFEGSNALVSGWGLIQFGGMQSIVLRVVEVPIISQASCKLSYGNYITENMICAGYKHGGKDACQGDSGGPLVVENEDGRYVLAGIVSWGLKCALPNFPGVYAKVNNFLPWIQNHINGSDTCQDSQHEQNQLLYLQ